MILRPWLLLELAPRPQAEVRYQGWNARFQRNAPIVTSGWARPGTTQIRASGSSRNFLTSGFFVEIKILTRQLPSSASCQSHVRIYFSQNPASSHVRIFRPGQCQDFSQHRACSEMHLQSNFMGFCMILAWLRSRVWIFFWHGQLG